MREEVQSKKGKEICYLIAIPRVQENYFLYMLQFVV